MPLSKRSHQFAAFINLMTDLRLQSYYRLITSPADREVTVQDRYTGQMRRMLMFASNNYLNLANHPYIREKVIKAINRYGTGIGGPPLLNGFTELMKELEERLADFKHQEAAMIFPTGYSTNLGLTSGLAQEGDVVLFDSLSHASLFDSLLLTKASAVKFEHNNPKDLEAKLRLHRPEAINLFVGVEGVYSMDGDLAPLDKIIPLCQKYKAYSWVDDAHGTGVLGTSGSGTAEHFGLSEAVDVSMGTFSKVFAVTGGFLAASRDLINYLRYFARSYMFSAALPPMTLAAVLAGLDVLEKEPERRDHLMSIAQYARKKLKPFGFYATPGSRHYRTESSGMDGHPTGEPGDPRTGNFPQCHRVSGSARTSGAFPNQSDDTAYEGRRRPASRLPGRSLGKSGSKQHRMTDIKRVAIFVNEAAGGGRTRKLWQGIREAVLQRLPRGTVVIPLGKPIRLKETLTALIEQER